ncbi:hypothetical protein FPQ18DRAFT_310768 [Pyronema domesticum]|nr:hypothetical protein FPQ18DRAFT_310768 [Pyronema domesticum]
MSRPKYICENVDPRLDDTAPLVTDSAVPNPADIKSIVSRFIWIRGVCGPEAADAIRNISAVSKAATEGYKQYQQMLFDYKSGRENLLLDFPEVLHDFNPGRWGTDIPQRDSEGSWNSREAPWLLRHRSHPPGGQDTIKASRSAQEKVQHLLHARCIFLHRISLARFAQQKELLKSFFTIRDVSKKTLSDSIQYWLDMDQVIEDWGWLIGYPDHVNWIELRHHFKTIGRQPELLEPILLDELPGRLLIIGPHNPNYKRAVSNEEKDIHQAVCQKVMDTPSGLVTSVNLVGRDDNDSDGDGNDVELQFGRGAVAEMVAKVGTMI